jgi:hypothetical protein
MLINFKNIFLSIVEKFAIKRVQEFFAKLKGQKKSVDPEPEQKQEETQFNTGRLDWRRKQAEKEKKKK